jgi:capsular exopolysaccharide synthesis family protein
MARDGSNLSTQDVIYPPLADGSASRALAPMPAFGAAAPGFGGFAPRGPEILYGGFNQTWLAHCLRRRWLMAILMGLLVGLATTALLLWLFPSMSQVTAYLKVKSRTESPFESQPSARPSAQEIERQAMNHLALLKSYLVLQAALQKQDVADLDAVRNQDGEEMLWLMEEMRVSFPGDGEILEVRYEGEEDADQMVKVINAVVDAYQDKVLFQDKLLAVTTQDDLRRVLGSMKQNLERHLTELKTKMSGKGVLQEEVEIPQLQREIASLEELIVEAQKELVDIEVMRQLAISNSTSASALDAAIQEALDKDPAMRMYTEQLFTLRTQLQSAQASSRNQGSARIRQIQSNIQNISADMDQYRAETEKAMRDRYKKMPNDALRAAILEHNIRYKAATESLKNFQSKLEAAQEKLNALGVQDPEIEMLQQNIESEQEIVKSLELKTAEWDVLRQATEKGPGQASDLESVSVMQEASGLANVNTVERWSIAGIGGAAAFALTCYGIALLEFRRRRLNGPSDVDEGLGVRVLGVLPPTSLKGLAGNSLVATQVAEAIDNVRATLMHDSTSSPRQVVMCTASGSQEGTTVVASSLALSLSRAGRRTLLVDADLRSAALHKLFGMALEDGLSEVLRSEIDLADAVRPTNNEGLYLLTAGVCSAEAIHALATEQPQAIFEKLRDQFDFIVIDAPPVLGISDALSIGQYVDGAILTVLRDHSEIFNIHKSVEILRNMGVRLLGTVVNGVPMKADRRVVRLHQAIAHQTPRLPAKAES